MDIHQLRVFIAVYDNKSFSRASEQLGISQPTVSEHIKNLEHTLSCRLFDRLPRNVMPTAEAEAIYPRAIQIIELAEALRRAATDSDGRITGSLKLGASTIPGTYILPEMAADFVKANPGVNFEVVVSDSQEITRMVLEHELLLGVVGAKPKSSMLEHYAFASDRLVLACRPDIAPQGASIKPSDLARLPFIMREEGSGTRRVMLEYLAEKGIHQDSLKTVAVLGSTDAVKQALKAGLGVSVLSKIAIDEELASGALVELKPAGLSMKREFYLIKHKRRDLPTPYKQFLAERAAKAQ